MAVAAGIVRTEQQIKRRNLLRGAFLIVSLVVSIGSNLAFPSFAIVGAQETSVQGSTIVISGKITANLGTSLEIDHLKTYPLHPHAKLKDEEGHGLELEAQDLEPGFNVKIRVKEGYIDQVLVLFPK
jgi:hypothetical protein